MTDRPAIQIRLSQHLPAHSYRRWPVTTTNTDRGNDAFRIVQHPDSTRTWCMRATDFPTRPEAPRRLPRLDPWRIEGLAVENLIERETGEAAMVNIKPKTTIQMRLSAVGETHSKSLVTARDVTATIDEPLERGGTNLGLSPTETLMSSLIGCTNVISKKIAHKAGFELGEMKVSLTSKFDRRGVLLMEEVDTPFTDIVMDIEVATNGTPEQMDAMKTDLAKFCPVAKVIRAAGVTITENWVIRPL